MADPVELDFVEVEEVVEAKKWNKDIRIWVNYVECLCPYCSTRGKEFLENLLAKLKETTICEKDWTCF